MKFLLRIIMAACLVSAGAAHAAPPGVTSDVGYWMLEPGRYLFVRAPGPEANAPCTDACASVWTPLVATDTAGAVGGWTIEQQPDGRKVWAYKGVVVYALINTARNGYAGESALWLLARVEPWYPPGVTIGEYGLLAKTDGGKLRQIGNMICDGECKTWWQPLLAPADAVDIQDWSVIKTEDGANAWAIGPKKYPVFEQRPAAALLPPDINPIKSSGMVGINAFPRTAKTAPIAIMPGALDLHDPDVTHAAKLAPGTAPPQYPPDALRAGEKGAIALQFCIAADGTMTSFTLAIPSPFKRLNDATSAWAPTLKFIPGEAKGSPAATCGLTTWFDWRY